jgi:hypothetical protein
MKITIQDMIDIASIRGGNCLSDKYVNAKTKLEWLCKIGHSWFATPNHIKNGTWCPTCSQNRVSDGQRLNITATQKLAAMNKGICLSKEYTNARTNLLWQCEKGHTWKAVYDSVKRGTWCPTCNGQEKKEIVDCQEYAAKFNGVCLSNEYVNAHTNLQWQCEKGHTWSASPNNVKKGQWCPKCGYASASEKLKMEIDEIRNLALGRGGKLLSNNYENAKTKLSWQCTNNHNWEATYDSIKRGTWCPVCSAGYGERAANMIFEEIFKLPFKKERPSWLRNVEGNQMEIDGYNEQLKIGFEHHGEQHYRKIRFYQTDEKFLKRQRDDNEKERLCKANNVILIIVPEIPNILPLDKAIPFILEELLKYDLYIPNPNVKLNLLKIFAGKKSLFEEVKDLAKSKGGKLLTPNYMGLKVKHSFECEKKHRWDANLYSIKKGSWCKMCDKNEKLDQLKIFADKKKGKCLSTEYVSTIDKLTWKCNRGHVWEAKPHHILNGTWCPNCAGIENWKKQKQKNK